MTAFSPCFVQFQLRSRSRTGGQWSALNSQRTLVVVVGAVPGQKNNDNERALGLVYYRSAIEYVTHLLVVLESICPNEIECRCLVALVRVRVGVVEGVDSQRAARVSAGRWSASTR